MVFVLFFLFFLFKIGKQALGWEEAGKTLNLDRLSFLCYELGSVQLVAFFVLSSGE